MITSESFNYNAIGDRLPPQNIEAEESILGGILLDPDAIARVKDILIVKAFSSNAHQKIYKTALQLHEHDKPIDLLTVTAELSDKGLLDEVGGQSKLVQLIDCTVSAVNIDKYVGLVMQHYVRRLLIHYSHKIAQLGYATHEPIGRVLNLAESEILAITRLKDFTPEDFKRVESELALAKLTAELREVDKIEQPFARRLKMREIMNSYKEYNIRSEKELLNIHASWLESLSTNRSYSLDEYFHLHGGKGTKWLLAGWLPAQSITFLYSKGGVGKTSLVNTIARALISGENWSGYDVDRPCRILWIQTDQGPKVTINLLDKQGFFTLSDEVRVRQRIIDAWKIEQYWRLEEELKRFKYDLVIIDSLHSVTVDSIYKENEQEFARPISNLRQIAGKYNCSFLILHHSSSSGNMRGTTALYNSADQVWKLERLNNTNDGQGNLTIEKSRFRQDKNVYRVQFDPDEQMWFSLGEVIGQEIENSDNKHVRAVRNFLKSHEGVGYEAKELSEALAINEHTLRKALPEAVRTGLIACFRGKRSAYVYFVGDLQQNNSADSDKPPLPSLPNPLPNSTNETNSGVITVSINGSVITKPESLATSDLRSALKYQKLPNFSTDPTDPKKMISSDQNFGSSRSPGTGSEFQADHLSGSDGSVVTELNICTNHLQQETDLLKKDEEPRSVASLSETQTQVAIGDIVELAGDLQSQGHLYKVLSVFADGTAKLRSQQNPKAKATTYRLAFLRVVDSTDGSRQVQPNIFTQVVDKELTSSIPEKPLHHLTAPEQEKVQTGKPVAQEDYLICVEWVRSVIEDKSPEAAQEVGELLKIICDEQPFMRSQILAILTPSERETFKRLIGEEQSSPPESEVEKAIASEEQSSPPESEVEKVIAPLGNSAPAERKRTRFNHQVGDRVYFTQKKGAKIFGTIVERKGSILYTLWDATSNMCAMNGSDLFPLCPEDDPLTLAKKLSEELKPGDKLKALKHPEHKAFCHRKGVVKRTGKRGIQFYALVILDNDKLPEEDRKVVFNLTAVKVIQDKL